MNKLILIFISTLFNQAAFAESTHKGLSFDPTNHNCSDSAKNQIQEQEATEQVNNSVRKKVSPCIWAGGDIIYGEVFVKSIDFGPSGCQVKALSIISECQKKPTCQEIHPE